MFGISYDKKHGKTINALAKEGKITPAYIEVSWPMIPGAKPGRLEFNSAWAACEWKKANGFYPEF